MSDSRATCFRAPLPGARVSSAVCAAACARVRLACALVCALLAAGCGYIGDVHPPTLDSPQRVNDFRAAEIGGNIQMAFTIAPVTTEGMPLTEIRSIELRVSGGADRVVQIPPKNPGPYAFEISAADFVGKAVVLAVRATGPKGKFPDWSNPWMLDVQPPLGPPENVKAANSPKEVHLTWTGNGSRYRIFRATGNGPFARVGESDAREFDDTSATPGTTYRYFVQAINGDTHQSGKSAEASITPQDVFPPAVPAGLAGAPGVGAIELVWDRNTEEDFAGYNVYRAPAGGEFQKIAGPIEAATYSDREIEAGRTYRYEVNAIDRAGNESARSAPVEVAAP